MSESPNFYKSAANLLEPFRDGSSKFPDYQANSDWLQRLNDDPAVLLHAVNDWCNVASWGIKIVGTAAIPQMPQGFLGLTDLLVLWCDAGRFGIDSTPLKDFFNGLYAREGDIHDVVTDVSFRLIEDMKSIFVKAIVVIERIKTLIDAGEIRSAGGPIVPGCEHNADSDGPHLSDCELCILKTLLENDKLTGTKLADRAGYPFNSNFKFTLSALRKRGFIDNKSPGYVITDRGKQICQDKRQD